MNLARPRKLMNGLAAAAYVLALAGSGLLHDHHDQAVCGHYHGAGVTSAGGAARAAAAARGTAGRHRAVRRARRCAHHHDHLGASHDAASHRHFATDGGAANDFRRPRVPESPARRPVPSHPVSHSCAACDYLAQPVVVATVVAIAPGQFSSQRAQPARESRIAAVVVGHHCARGPPLPA